MIQVPFKDFKGNTVDTLEVSEESLGTEVRLVLLREAVLMYEANKRVGTASTKGRSDRAGSTRKLYRQKGTGRARVGSGRAAQRRKGGIVFGPKPRDYSYSMPKKARRLATKSAFLAKLKDGEVIVIPDIEMDEPRTKHVADVLKGLGVERGCLIVTRQVSNVLRKSVRNIPDVWVSDVRSLNAYDVLRYRAVLVTKDALDEITGKNSEEESLADN